MKRVVMLGAPLLMICNAGLAGDFFDDFDSYNLGNLCDQSTWEEWEGSVNVCGEVSDEQANSGDQSLKIIGATGPAGDDTVHRFEEAGGRWVFKIMTFVPNNATGQASVILLNTYPASQNFHWSVVVALNANTNEVIRWPSTPVAALIKGRWVEFRTEIDLDADRVDYFYDNVRVVEAASWRDEIQPGGEARIQAVDLYGDEPGGQGTTGTYFDDVSLAAGGGGEDSCIYKAKKAAKAKGGCGTCPRKGDRFSSGDPCLEENDCSKKVKGVTIECPNGEGSCTKLKGTRVDCGQP